MPTPDWFVPAITAGGVIFAAWATLRGSWDRALLKAFSGEMTRLQSRVTSLEADVKQLRQALDEAHGDLEKTRRELALVTESRDEHAQLSAERARVILQYEAKINRLELRVAALLARLKLLGVAEETADALVAGETHSPLTAPLNGDDQEDVL